MIDITHVSMHFYPFHSTPVILPIPSVAIDDAVVVNDDADKITIYTAYRTIISKQLLIIPTSVIEHHKVIAPKPGIIFGHILTTPLSLKSTPLIAAIFLVEDYLGELPILILLRKIVEAFVRVKRGNKCLSACYKLPRTEISITPRFRNMNCITFIVH